MTGDTRVTLRWPVVVGASVLLLGVGAGATYVVMRRPSTPPTPAVDTRDAGTASGSNRTAPPRTTGASPDIAVTLSPEAVQRAGITVATATVGRATSALRVPGVVEANAYKQVTVTPIVTGRVIRVLVELGQSVRRGQSLAEIFSPELSEAETRYISARAELDAHERELARTEKLVDIGAASRQELERLHADHTAKQTAVDSARARLELLGIQTSAIDALAPGKELNAVTTVPAPITGVVTERLANAGLNVDASTKLLTVVDLSTVWVVADVYEKDFSQVRVGASSTVTTKAYPDKTLSGRVSYIDPAVNPQTRTAKVRIEVDNPRGDLRLGMFADVSLESSGQNIAVRVPRSAVQRVGDRTVVYLADAKQPGRFVERAVTLGDATGDDVDVVAGLAGGDTVVAEGSFFVRAERERLGLASAGASPTASNGPSSEQTKTETRVQEAKVLVTERGYEPAKMTLRAGVPVRITFLRTTDKTCGTEVVFPSLNIRRALPLNQPIDIEFTPSAAGEIGFVCGMNMLRGTVVVQ